MGRNLHYASIVLGCVFCWVTSYGQTPSERLTIQEQNNNQKLTVLNQQFKQQSAMRKAEAIRQAELNGWETIIIDPDGGISELMAVSEEGLPIYFSTENNGAAITTRANTLYSGGSLGLNVEGQNMNIAVWDGGGVRRTHELFNGRVTQQDTPSTALNSHATHVSGTLIGNGNVQAGNARGMAFRATLDAYDWNNDESEVAAAAANGLLVSSHSYGVNAEGTSLYYLGKYDLNARNFDELMFNAPFYQMVCSAGNDQQDNINTGDNGYDKLTDMSLSKNAIVVAAVEQVNNYTGPSSVVMSNFSTWGPTDDGRIKPDISSKGVAMFSSTSANDSSYGTSSGTSMSTPSVAGTLLLLQQHYNDVNSSYMRAATLRGLALHTADEAGNSVGPDYRFGWGLINAERAAQAITGNGSTSKISEEILTEGGAYTTTVNALGNEPLMVTIAWTDLNGEVLANIVDLATPSLVNDLDVRVTKGSDVFYPWKLDPANPTVAATQEDNSVDNIEKVQVDGAIGEYTITVTHKGTLVGNIQNFSIIITGASETEVVCSAELPTDLRAINMDSDRANLLWNSVPGAAYDVRYKKAEDTVWTVVPSSNAFLNVTQLEPSTAYEAQVRSKCDTEESAYSASVNFSTLEFEVEYCSSKGNSVNDEYISNVTIGTINNDSDAGNGYSDFTSISTSLEVGKPHTITITPTWTGTIYDEAYAVWIDYNGDGDFTGAGETVWTKAVSKETPVSGTFTIPAETELGSVRMRVSMKYNAIPNPCETFNYGEVEDYTIQITGPVDTEAPSAPTELASNTIEDNSVSLSWTAATDNVAVTGYDLYQGGVLVNSLTTTNTTVTGLTENTAYEFYVIAKDEAGNQSVASNTIIVTTTGPDVEIPSTPGELVASNIMDNSISLSWTAATDNIAVTGYDLYQGGVLVSTVSTTSTTVTGLTQNTTYEFYVVAKDEAGNLSVGSNTVTATTTGPDVEAPSAPTQLVANSIMDNSVELSWTAATDNIGVTGYDLYQDNILVSTILTTSTMVTGLTANTDYSFYVVAKDEAGNLSSGSNSVSVTTTGPDIEAPTAPTELVAVNVTNSSIQLSWTAATDNIAVIGYDIYQDSVFVTSVTTTNSTIIGLAEDTAYGFYVVAKDEAGNLSVASNSISATTLGPDIVAPSTPTELVASAITTSSVQLSWTAATDNIAVIGYDLYQDNVLVSSITSTNATVTGLTESTAYGFYVVAKDEAGNLSAGSNSISVTTLTPDVDAPSIPTELVASSIMDNSVQLSWTAATDNVAVTGYDLYQDNVLVNSISTTSTTVNGLSTNTSYSFYVVAKDEAGNLSAGSNTVSVTTTGPDIVAPSIPTNLIASNITFESVDLNWDASTDNEGPIEYEVYQNDVVIDVVTTNSLAVTGISENTNYSFYVIAKDAANNKSVASNIVDIITLIAPDTEAPTTPTGLVASNITETSLELNWTASTDNVAVVEYEVYQDGVLIATEASTSTIVTNLTIASEYGFYIVAKDEAGNASANSTLLTVSTISDIAVPVYFEAESAEGQSLFAPLQVVANNDACGGSHIEVAAGNNSITGPASSGIASYTFTTATDGEVYVWMRVNTPSGSDDSFHVTMDDGNFYTWNGITASQGWAWLKIPQTYNVAAGSHTFQVAYREDGSLFDKLYVTNSVTDIPSGCDESIPVPGAIPWIEDFTLANGTSTDNNGTNWTSVSSGTGTGRLSEVLDGRFAIRRSTSTWSSQVIDISSATSVDISMEIEGDSPAAMESADYLKVSYILDGGEPVLFSNNTDGFAAKTISANGLTGSTLQIYITGKTSYTNETYYIDNISITGNSVETRIGDDKLEADVLDFTEDGRFVLYPNPTVNSIHITGVESGVKYEIYTLGGRLVADDKLSGAIDVSDLAQGSYVIRVNGPQGIILRPFTKQ